MWGVARPVVPSHPDMRAGSSALHHPHFLGYHGDATPTAAVTSASVCAAFTCAAAPGLGLCIVRLARELRA